MRVIISDDFQNAVRGLKCSSKRQTWRAFDRGAPINVINPAALREQ